MSKRLHKAISVSPRFLRIAVSTALGMALNIVGVAWAGETGDGLNLDFLQGGNNPAAATFLSSVDSYFPGRYWVDVRVNGVVKGKRVLNITPEEQHGLCFTPAWLAEVEVYVRPDFYASTRQTLGDDVVCYALGNQPNSTVNFDLSTQTLNLTLPQAGLTKVDDSQEWEFGNNALRLNYNVNANKTTDGVDYYGSGSLLANVGEWIARGNASLTQDEQSISVFTVSKAILALQADLLLGKMSVSSGELSGLSTYGMTLRSNQSMRRQTQGYTPVFSGSASSNARVTLRQGNTVLYSEMVPPGPFNIDDVTVLSGGDIVMNITENDGSTTTQVFPITLISGQISPGEHEYSVSLGIIDNDNPDGTPSGGLGAFSYGYGLEHMSVRVGALLGSQFTGVTGEATSQLGVLGSLSAALSGTQSRYDEGKRQGQKTTLAFAKTFDIGTTLRLSFNRLSEEYDTLGEYNDLDYANFKYRQRLKEDLTVGFSQPLWKGATFSVNGWQRTYWQRDDKQQGVTGNLSTYIGQVSVSLAGSYYKMGAENQYGLSTSVSIPLSVFDRDYTMYASMSGGKTGSNSYSAGASTSLTDRWSLSANESWGGGVLGNQTSLWTAYDGRLAQLSGQMTHTNSDTFGAGSINGSFMYLPTDNSFLLGKNISDTVAVVHVSGGAGVTILGDLDKTDRNGNLMVPLSSYQVNTLSIDASTLPVNEELAVTSKKIKPTGSSVTYVPFEAMSVKRYLLQVKRPNGQFISAGEWAYAESGAPLGFVSQNGVILINSVDSLGTVRFSDCRVPGAQLTESNRLQEVVCEY